MPRVVHFELPSDDPKRAVAFYKKVFGWKIERWKRHDYWMVTTGTGKALGIDGAIMPRAQQKTTVNTIDVPSVDKFTAKIVSAGGKVVAPKMTVSGVGYMAYCKDTEGNVFGLMEWDDKAK